ncbi:MAG: hypothetical protein ACKORK_05590 [Gemmatimonadota bacterium]
MDAARELVRHDSWLYLDGLTSVPTDVAAVLDTKQSLRIGLSRG